MIAREALEAALRYKRTPELAIRAATSAMNAGDAPAALRLAPLSDAKGDSANVTIEDVNQSNGVIQVIDTVLMPS